MFSLFRVGLVGLNLFCFTTACCLAAEPKPKDDPKQIEKLLSDLSSDKFQTREAASAALTKIGAPVVPALESVLKGQADTEQKFRIGKIIEKIRRDEIANNPLHLSELMEEVRLANQGKLDQQTIEALLDRLLLVLRETTGREFALPVAFDDVVPGEAKATSCRQKLVIAPRAKFTSVKDSIILSDVDAHFTSAYNCIIISRAAVRITGAYNCVVVSGHSIRTTGCRDSIMLAGSRLRTNSSEGSIIGATDGVVFTGANNSDVVNSDVSQIPERRLPRVLKTPGLVLKAESVMNPFVGRTTVLKFVEGLDGAATFKLLGVEGEFTAKVDGEILGADGKPADDFKGWKLVYVSRDLAAFQSATQMAYVPIEP